MDPRESLKAAKAHANTLRIWLPMIITPPDIRFTVERLELRKCRPRSMARTIDISEQQVAESDHRRSAAAILDPHGSRTLSPNISSPGSLSTVRIR